MARVYTSVFEIIKEIQFYNAVYNGEDLNLSYFRQIAQNRWGWVVQNWSTLYERFNQFANGEDDLLSDLEVMNREVEATRLGTKLNPLERQDRVIQFDDFLSTITIEELNLTPDESTYFNNEVERILNLDIDSLKSAKTFLRKEQSILADTIGLGDPAASQLLGLTPATKKREPTIDDLARIDELQNLMDLISGMIFNLQQTTKRPPNLLTFANESITSDSEVVMNDTYQSYILVPFEISLEDMAQKYLGSKDRWYELVTVNNLQPPFVDEKGIKINLIANAALNSVIVSTDQKSIIYVGQKLNIGSNRYREETRIIEQIIVNENNTMVIYLSGNRDLNKYITKEGAYIRVFLPNTTRRGQFVSIPQEQPGFSAGGTKTPSANVLQRLSAVFRNFGVDISHDESTGDIQIDPNGNFKYAYGLANVRQAVLNAVKTEQGELPFHPDYGVNLALGERFYGTTDEALLFGELIRDTIIRDGRFSNVLLAGVASTGTSVSIKLTVFLDGTAEPVSLSFIA